MTSRRAAYLIIALMITVAGCAPRLQPPGDGPVQPELIAKSGEWRAEDGFVLPLRRWLPEGEPKAVILALHGFNDYSHAFEDAAAWWAKHGIATYAPDQRGFGAAPYRGLWPGEERLAQDVSELTRLLRRRYPDKPLYWLGESMGGAVALETWKFGGNKPDGMILGAPAVWGRDSMPVHYRMALWFASYTMPWMTVTGQGLHILASDNIEMLRGLSRDPMVIKHTRIDTIHGLVNLMDDAEEARPSSVPILLLYGAKDEVIPREPVEKFAAALSGAPHETMRVVVYDDGWHMLFRDLQAEVVWRDVAAWIDNKQAALPSGEEIYRLPLFAARDRKN